MGTLLDFHVPRVSQDPLDRFHTHILMRKMLEVIDTRSGYLPEYRQINGVEPGSYRVQASRW